MFPAEFSVYQSLYVAWCLIKHKDTFRKYGLGAVKIVLEVTSELNMLHCVYAFVPVFRR
jgi:hypothetical protein